MKVTHRKPDPIAEGIEKIQRAQNNEDNNGIFVIKAGALNVSEHLMYEYLIDNGYYQRNGRVVHLVGNVLTLIEDTQRYFHLLFRDHVATYSEYKTVNRAGVPIVFTTESFLKVWMKFASNFNFKNAALLQSLPEHTEPVLQDTPTTIHFVFRNGVLAITAKGIKLVPMDKITAPVWSTHIIDHDIKVLKKTPKSHYAKFIYNLADRNKSRELQLWYLLGYLMHDYHNPERARIPILYDTTNKKGKHGGTGKDVLLEGITKVRAGLVLDGKEWKMQNDNEFFFSSVREHHRLVIISESKGQAMFDALYVKSQGPTTIRVKRKDDIVIPKDRTPKFAITSNMFFDASDSSNKRRQMPVILSGHYRDMGVPAPIVKEHGCIFYSKDWDETEWNNFYLTLATIAQTYLATPEPEYDFSTVTRQAFQIKYGPMATFILGITEPNLPDFIDLSTISVEFCEEFLDLPEDPNDRASVLHKTKIELSERLCHWLDSQRVTYEKKRIGRGNTRKTVLKLR